MVIVNLETINLKVDFETKPVGNANLVGNITIQLETSLSTWKNQFEFGNIYSKLGNFTIDFESSKLFKKQNTVSNMII